MKTIVVGVGLKSEPVSEIKENLIELEELVIAAGGEIVGSTVQVLPQWNPSTLIGSGKVLEITIASQRFHYRPTDASAAACDESNSALNCHVFNSSE